MKLIRSIYKTKNLSKNGKFILISCIALLFLGPLLIPEFKPESEKQFLTLNGNYLKYDNPEIVNDFLNSIKSNNGYLCLGTSESTSIPNEGNYFNFLNDDPEIDKYFSILSGAGRTCGKYIPVFLNHREAVKSLKIIYFINPVYWGDDLNKPNKVYWNRYSNYSVQNNRINGDSEKYYASIYQFQKTLAFGEKVVLTTDYWLRKLRSSYFIDLQFSINSKKYFSSNKYLSDNRNKLTSYKNFGKINVLDIDTVLSISTTHDVLHLYQSMSNNSNYRSNELLSFIQLCKDLKIEVTYLLGPYNNRLVKNKFEKDLEKYELRLTEIKQILLTEEVDFIDASDISYKPGTFKDPLHHTAYGAYLLYLKIKEHLNEK